MQGSNRARQQSLRVPKGGTASAVLVLVLVLALTLAAGFPFAAALLSLGTACGLPPDLIILPLSILVNLFPVTSTDICHAQ